eukprot:1953688-Prymnesium_polylepis.1
MQLAADPVPNLQCDAAASKGAPREWQQHHIGESFGSGDLSMWDEQGVAGAPDSPGPEAILFAKLTWRGADSAHTRQMSGSQWRDSQSQEQHTGGNGIYVVSPPSDVGSVLLRPGGCGEQAAILGAMLVIEPEARKKQWSYSKLPSPSTAAITVAVLGPACACSCFDFIINRS